MRPEDSWPLAQGGAALGAAILLTLTSMTSCGRVDPQSTLNCHVRTFTYSVSKEPITTEEGRLLECYGEITVTSCWGRCDSSEIADYKIPYKDSDHPVCTYLGKQRWLAKPSNCHPDYPEPLVEAFNATTCVCRQCASHDTSCETLHT